MVSQVEFDPARADRSAPRPSISDRSDRLYAFMREHLFRDDTERINAALWPDGLPRHGISLVDIGCGPGTYARRLAARHPGLRAIGIDRSPRQLERARDGVRNLGVDNCRFELGDAMRLPLADSSVDAVLASRLLMVLSDPERALAEIYRILRPGGRCFIAEPRPGLRAALPTFALRLVGGRQGEHREPRRVPDRDADWDALLDTQPWGCVLNSADRRYRYAVCDRNLA